jgi:aspartate/methionine/tyrosine aminotransferase
MSFAPRQLLQEFFDTPLAKQARFNLSASAGEPMSRAELLGLEDGVADGMLETTLDYPRRHGSAELVAAIAAHYEGVDDDGVVVTSGLDDALGLLFLALVKPGDRVVVLTPAYPPHLLLPQTRGADVVPWQARPENDWVPSLDELRELIKPKTRLVVATFPQNPTGFMPDQNYVNALVAVLREHDTLLVSDEIYAGLPHESAECVNNLTNHYEHAITMHGLSKTYGLPGLRVGWLASRDNDVIRRIRKQRELFNCYVPPPVDFLARLALRHEGLILQRNGELVRENLAHATRFFARHDNHFRWCAPKAGVLSFPRWLDSGGTRALSEQLLQRESLAFAPSYCFDAGDEHLRLSVSRRSFPDALERLEHFLGERLER